jgi:cysteine sulfinate desulfinase/cysteine desulfurase-like protein
MNVPEELARGTLRLSTGRMTTSGQVQAAVTAIAAAAEKLRAAA